MSCEAAASFEQARQLLETQPFDILLSDIHLSEAYDAEGIEVMGLARSLNPDLLVLGMSSDTSCRG